MEQSRTVEPTAEQIEAHLADDGPVHAAYVWLASFLRGEDFYATWAGVDPDLRLVLAQAWLVANREHPDLARHDLEQARDALALERPTHDLTVPFGLTQLAELRAAWPWIDLDNLGVGVEPRIVAPGYEAISLTILTGDSETSSAPELRLLMHHAGGRWLVAGLHTDELPIVQL